MKSHPKVIKRQRADYKEKLRDLRAYLSELDNMCKELGTEGSVVEADIIKAKHDIEYYETQLEQVKKRKDKDKDKDSE